MTVGIRQHRAQPVDIFQRRSDVPLLDALRRGIGGIGKLPHGKSNEVRHGALAIIAGGDEVLRNLAAGGFENLRILKRIAEALH